jgi:hypothetical protein
MVIAAEVWHYWISVFLAIPFALAVVAMAALYVAKVMAAKYPRQ